MTKQVEGGEKKATRQCWECLKRRLVCDHTLPQCQKCVKAGKECPGYHEQKPLQWIEPGRVTSRRREKDSAPKVYTVKPKARAAVTPVDTSLPSVGSKILEKSGLSDAIAADDKQVVVWPIFDEPPPSQEAVDHYKCQLAFSLLQEENAAWWSSLTAEEQTEHINVMATQHAGSSDVAARIMQIGSQKNLKVVVERGQHWEAALLLRSERQPLERLRRMLCVMEMQELPSYEYLSNETCEVVQAVNYCKVQPSARDTPTNSISQHPYLSRRQGNRSPGAQSCCDPLPSMGAACSASRNASYSRVLGSEPLYTFPTDRS